MDLIKIGKFISTKRKENNLTQSELAEKLGVSDRAVSKWENGVCLPDAGNMSPLCQILGISINDLFSGEVVTGSENEKKLECNLLEMAKLKEEKDKLLLLLEIVFCLIHSILFFAIILIVSYLSMSGKIKIAIIIADVLLFLVTAFFMLGIEQKAGFYECKKCGHKYIPS
nr:helix-turn-helix domain-containing protein [Treponemataceae bacterium]